MTNGMSVCFDNSHECTLPNLHTARMDPAGLLVPHIRHAYAAEGCSRAWVKMFHFCSAFEDLLPSARWGVHGGTSAQVVPDEDAGVQSACEGKRCRHARKHELRTLHLCEAPGGFVLAMNHFMRSRYPCVEWSWTASTLRGEGSGKEQDGARRTASALELDPIARNVAEKSFPLLRQYASHWVFGHDGSGPSSTFIYSPRDSESCIDSAFGTLRAVLIQPFFSILSQPIPS